MKLELNNSHESSKDLSSLSDLIMELESEKAQLLRQLDSSGKIANESQRQLLQIQALYSDSLKTIDKLNSEYNIRLSDMEKAFIRESEESKKTLADLKLRLFETSVLLRERKRERLEFKEELKKTKSSISWKITYPIRLIEGLFFGKRISGISNKRKIESAFEVIPFREFDVLFATRGLADERGIGRVTTSILEQLKLKSASLNMSSFGAKANRKKIYFFSSVHYCPKDLPSNSVVMIHDVTPLIFPEKFADESVLKWMREYSIIAKQAEELITISESSAEDISRTLRIPVRDMNVIYNGVELPDVPSKVNLDLPAEPYFVHIGSADFHKNIEVVLDAFQRSQILIKTKLLLIGNTEDWRELVAQKGLDRRVIFMGKLTDEEMVYVVQRSRALVCPSLYEGFGLPPLEAAKLGIPSICSTKPAMTETLEGAAFFASPHSVDDWARAMEMVLEDEGEALAVAKRAQKKANNFTWESNVDSLYKIFSRLAAKGDKSIS